MDKCEFNIRVEGILYTLTKNTNKPKKDGEPQIYEYDGKIELNSILYEYQSVADFNWTLTNSINGNKKEIENKEALMYFLDNLKYEEVEKTAAVTQKRLYEKGEEIELKKKAKEAEEAKEAKRKLREFEKRIVKHRTIIQKLKSIKYNHLTLKKTVCVGVIQILGEVAHKSKIFVVRQKRNGKWMLPGGYLDAKDEEGVYGGLLREIKEETGIVINKRVKVRGKTISESEYKPLFIDYKYFETANKSLDVCVVHILLDLPISLEKINNLFKARTTHQDPTETDRWGYYNFHDKTIEKYKRGQLTPVINPVYRDDLFDNLETVQDTCKFIDDGKL